MCSGLGACRKKLEGTMCPSYMVTREEQHSTRGRANALRLAMTGQLSEAGLTGPEVKSALDLCLECRACKAECPVGVDVARFKSEFLAAYWSENGLPLRSRLLGDARRTAAVGSALAPVSNWIAASALARRVCDRFLGVDARRPLPKFSSRTLAHWFSRRESSANARAMLFNDTFTNFYHPEVGIAAAEVIERAGVPVGLAPNVCCGRPLISQGVLSEARDLAQQNVGRLFDLAARGVPLVFCEPSCLSAIREDAPALLRGELQRKAKVVAAASKLFEEFAAVSNFPLRRGPTRILLHGHCHQKAMGLLAPAKTLLERIPGAEVVDLDAGCCGMAGSFGYVKEHFALSEAIAERKLLPAARGMKEGEVLVASGMSCRHQVHDFTQRNAVHPAQLLRELLS
jgi:Fe-S oxidoreductase